ncbi:conserved hypothetical protein conserved hypothetical protein [Pantoea ananatis AJ13355]|uniref:Uncharacterized protein n=1 Tax=Pantoea ananatis (strain AJ13355) TaxID=932677 RepID=A0A0H3KT25_PANAA|nr:conserved hypothetical protein conserved hypothetical protein [Pantoea ananatis AJ13355]
MHASRATEDHQVQQRVATQTVRPVYRYAGDFTHREQARNHFIFALLIHTQRLTGDFGWHAAHHVVTGWDNRNRLFNRVNVSKGTGQLKDARQARFQHFRTQVIEFQLDVRAPWTVATTTFTDLHHHRTGHNVTTGKVFGVRRIALHETLTVFVQQITAFTTTAFGDQYTSTGDTGWVELPHFHILHRHARAQRHANTVAGIDVGVRRGLINTSCTARRQNGGLGFEVNRFAGFHADCRTAYDGTVVIFDQIQCIPFGEDSGFIFQVLLIQRMQQCVAGTVGRCGSTRRLLTAEVFRLTTKRTLINAAVIKTGEGQAHVLQFQNRFRTDVTHVFDRVLVTDVVGTFDGVIHMPFPVIVMGVTQRNGDSALRGDRMGTGREDFGQQGTGLARLGDLQRRAHTRAACADHHGIKFSYW